MNLLQPSHRRASFRRSSFEEKSSRASINIGSSSNLLNLKGQADSDLSKPISRCKKLIIHALDHWTYIIFITSLTLYALLGDDIRVSSTSLSSDNIFYSLTVVCFFFFSLEIMLSSYAQEDYWLGFFFWLDLVATISLIPDIGWIWDQVIGTSSNVGSTTTNASQIARAGRASRAGARAARIIRIIRVIRLVRIVKLYKISQNALRKRMDSNLSNKELVRGSINYRGQEIAEAQQGPFQRELEIDEDSFSYSQSFSSGVDRLENNGENNGENYGENNNEALANVEASITETNVPEESKIGKKFSELTTRRVIILVLFMIFFIPLFSTDLYLDGDVSFSFGLMVINSLANNVDFSIGWSSYISRHTGIGTPLIYLELIGVQSWNQGPDVTSLRSTETLYVAVTGSDNSSIAVFDLRSSTRLEAWLNIARTVFVCVVLAVSTISLSKDAQELVIMPIENMIAKVKKIAENPLRAAHDEEKIKYSTEHSGFSKKKNKAMNTLETIILEETITKIGALLALGFGEAGSEIIAMNMQRVGGEVDPMIPGKITYCIFGFCDIRNFTEATEVLQQDIMSFVNEIALIVHRNVDYFSGFANKNIGDAFLLVWKFSDKLSARNEETHVLELTNDFIINQIADMAVISFLKIIIDINTDRKVLKYREHEGLNRLIPGYSVNMGFGLHQGWAIEGAIGSEFKIDASYLSPNVNMASRLEAATRQFGVPILISEALYSICSKHTQTQLRKVDRVTVKGSKVPLDLYTCDMVISELQADGEDDEMKIYSAPSSKFENRNARERLMEDVRTGAFVVSSLFDSDEKLVSMKKFVSKAFLKAYAIALKDYLGGRWVEARAGLLKAQELKGSYDGPCQIILEFIEELNCKAPDNWQGHRELHDK